MVGYAEKHDLRCSGSVAGEKTRQCIPARFFPLLLSQCPQIGSALIPGRNQQLRQ